MNLVDYANAIRPFAIYPKEKGAQYCALGLYGETGEVLNQWKKVYRDDNGVISPERLENLLHELGDVLWYAVRMAVEWGLEIDKLEPNPDLGFRRADPDLPDVTDLGDAVLRLGAATSGPMLIHANLLKASFVDHYELVSVILDSLALVARLLNIDLGHLAQINYEKLASRAERGTLQGSGDHR